MKLRDYAAIATGTLTFVASAMAQWVWTQRPIEDVIFIALMVGFIGMMAFAIATEPKRKQPRRKHAAPRNQWTPERPVMVTLDRAEWEGSRR